jgi:hypothetical protein
VSCTYLNSCCGTGRGCGILAAAERFSGLTFERLTQSSQQAPGDGGRGEERQPDAATRGHVASGGITEVVHGKQTACRPVERDE